MERTIGQGEDAISFSVRRSRRRRTVALRVDPSGAIIVYAPHFVWGPFIDRFVQKQRDWIFKKRVFFKDRPVAPPITAEEREQLIKETQARLPSVVALHAKRLGVLPAAVKVTTQKHRWGSCSSQGILRFSWRLARLPEDVFQYIVIHELAHLRHMNHSPLFWSTVQSVCPDYKSHRRWLRQLTPGYNPFNGWLERPICLHNS